MKLIFYGKESYDNDCKDGEKFTFYCLCAY